MSWYIMALKKYAVFNGRSRRKEFWMFFLFDFIFVIVTMLLDKVFGGQEFWIWGGPIGFLYDLATFLPGIAVAVRRMHDIGKNGWFLLIPFYNIILTASEGTKGENKYGPDPKENI